MPYISSDIRYGIWSCHISVGYTAGTFCYKTCCYLDVPVDSSAWQIEQGFIQGMVTAWPTLLTYREKVMKGRPVT